MSDRDEQQAGEAAEAEERSAPAARVVHAAVAEQGEDELARPVASLFWSGFAAGIAIMASLWVSGALRHYLPEADWAEPVIALGYPAGFLIVILGRLQLFTEHTAVAVLPVVRAPSARNLVSLARLWSVIFVANMLGALIATALAVHAHLQPPDTLAGMIAVSEKLLERAPLDTLMQAIPAGFLIASIAWIRSAVNSGDFWIVFAVTYAISLGGFAHVVAGASEAFLLMWAGQASVGWALGGFVLPALLGNILGGTGLFALLAHAQVKNEIKD
ncbi:formate/nitrite transporter family protein [Sphingomonas sp. 8AM]|uniref:formate/nitrite transporter family protein n=1 Tax=Sphingomonas sp. 8AM TaxID=2653170 RepID=UPI0012F21B8E|nr:formate/nitrite transporter family protein [Sphingomonas sp. 8AM]VXC35023.1 Formate/nitrite transporter family protein [Sphingomonas sp. 8AM]